MIYVPTAFSQQRVIVVGDTMIDKFVRAQGSYYHQGEQLPVLETYSAIDRPGGAGNIAANIVSLGGEAIHIGVVGDDDDAGDLRSALQSSKVRSTLIVDSTRPTTRKLRIHQNGKPLVRVDTESTDPVAAEVERQVVSLSLAALPKASALVISDYRKGVVTPPVAKRLVGRARSLGLPAIVDSKSPDIRDFRGCTVFKSNRHELEAVLGRELLSEKEKVVAARSISRTLGGAIVIMTDGERGLIQVDEDGNYHHARSHAKDIKSVVGAGDTVAACLALACSAGMDITDGVDLAALAAAEALGSFHTTSVRGRFSGDE